MDLIVPHQPLNVTSTNVSASTEANWSSSTEYTLGQRCKHLPDGSDWEHEFESKQTNTNQEPILRGSDYWIDLGAVNQHRMFDGLNNSKTEADDPSGGLIVEINMSTRVQSLHLLGLSGVEGVTVEQRVDEALIATHTADLMTMDSPVGYWSWLYGNRVYTGSYAVELYGVYTHQTIKITMTGSPAQCAQCILGNVFWLGDTETNASPRLQSFSTFEPNEFGIYTFTPRPNTRQGRYTVWVDTDQIDRVYSLMEKHENKLVILDANNTETSFDCLRTYGKITDFSPGITYDKTAFNIDIQGLH